MAELRRRTTARRDLERIPHFTEISPAPGRIDEEALADLVEGDLDAGLTLLAEMTGAVDPVLRELARKLAGRLLLRLGRRSASADRLGGFRYLVPGPAGGEGDVDLDGSLDAVLAARAGGRAPSVDELVARRWTGPRPVVALVVDRSGSMGGARLATGALAASVVAHRLPEDHTVLAFAADVTVVKGLRERRGPGEVVDELLALRGHGSTDLSLALRVAREQLHLSGGTGLAPGSGSGAGLRSVSGADLGSVSGAGSGTTTSTVVLISDCRHNGWGRPADEVRGVDRFAILAPAGDADEAAALAGETGAQVATVRGPSDVVPALARLLG